MSLARVSSVLAVLGGIAILGPGCGGDDEEEPLPVVPLPTASEFCNLMGQVVCNATVVTACYGSAGADETASCVEAYARPEVCNPQTLPYHGEGAQACLDMMSAVYGDANITQDEVELVYNACLPVHFLGGLQGTECAIDSDCDAASGLRCVSKAGDDKGTCQVPEKVGAGEDCSAPAAVCPDGMFCSEDGCVNDKPIGFDECSPAKPCVDEALCSDPIEGTCEEKTANGDACQFDQQCLSGFCTKAKGSLPEDDGTCTGTSQLAVTAASCEPFLN